MVHPCAKLPTSRSHCVPIFPIEWCHRFPILRIRVCHHWPRGVTHVPSYPPSYAKVAKSRCHCVPSCPSQGAIAYQVAHRKVPLLTKLPIASHCVPSCPSQGAIVCHVAHHKVPSCGILPIARCYLVQNLLCQGVIVWRRFLLRGAIGGYLMVPPWTKFPISLSHAYVPHVKEQSCAYFPHVKVPSFSFVAHPMCPLLCPKFSIAWGAPRVPREAIT